MKIADIPINSLIIPYCKIDVSDIAYAEYQVSVADIHRFETQYIIPKNSLVIFNTGWEKWWSQSEKYKNNYIFPTISEDAAKYLLSKEIVGLGIDTLSPDRADSEFPVHNLLLSRGKYIIENIANAKGIGPTGFAIALPIKIEEGTEAPIRLIGLWRD